MREKFQGGLAELVVKLFIERLSRRLGELSRAGGKLDQQGRRCSGLDVRERRPERD